MSLPHESEVFSDDLYREVILQHYAKPKHRKKLEECTHQEEGVNPSCGDEITVELIVKEGKIQDIAFQGHGCSISQASASMMTQKLYGKPIEEALKFAHLFKENLLDRQQTFITEEGTFGDLEAFDGVRNYPVRIKCALLAWNTFLQAIEFNPPKENQS